jgi:hypothetical protein
MMSHRLLPTSGGSSARLEFFKLLKIHYSQVIFFPSFPGGGADSSLLDHTGLTHFAMLPSGHAQVEFVDKCMNPFKSGLPECR